MSDEIKKIINQLEIVARKHIIEVCEDGSKIETMPASIVNELRLNNYSSKVLLDYITNLQQENERLKSDLECYGNGVYYSSENDELQSRINKAIEYCNKEIRNIIANFDYIDTKDLENVRNILKGNDKE